jgi:tetratricopeptide (TPR) repeat protein
VYGHPGLESEVGGRRGQRQPRQLGDQPAQGLLQFYPGKLGAEAVVRAAAESQMADWRTGDVEPVRLAEHRRVPVGRLDDRQDDLAEAAACYERALSIFRTVGDRWGEADALTNLGDVRRAAGEPLHAREAWQQALAILDDLQHPDGAKVRAKIASIDP